MPTVGSAAALRRHEELRALHRDAAVGGGEEIGRKGDGLLEIRGGIEDGYLAVPEQHAHMRGGVEVAQRRFAAEPQRDGAADRDGPTIPTFRSSIARPRPFAG